MSREEPTQEASNPGARLSDLLERLEQSILGQRPLLERLVVALLAGGHVLIEGVPGLAKTRAVRCLASALGLPFRRIQFTPDLLPADLTGTQVYRPATAGFETRPGPIVTNVLLADEINRAPAKVQSALLEAMQERQVTIGDETVHLPDPFFVLATQNPIEHEGTYPLPEAQLDRFLFKLVVRYPDRASELAMLDLPDLAGPSLASLPPGESLYTPVQILAMRDQAARIHVDPAIKEYTLDLVRATRDPESFGLGLAPLIELGASPRATLALVRTAQALALLRGRDYALPQDVKSLAPDVLRHRILPSYEADAENLTADDLITKILAGIRLPT